MMLSKRCSPEVLIFLLATSCLIAVTLGALVWNASQVRQNQAVRLNIPLVPGLKTPSTEKLTIQLPVHHFESFFNAVVRPSSRYVHWCWPPGNDYLYLLNTEGGKVVVDRISLVTGKGSRIVSLKQQRKEYKNAFGTEDRIYLLRTDISGARYRILGDILSIVENRIIETRTFLDLPLQEAGRLVRTLWSPDGAWLLVIMVHFEGKSEQMFRTHVIASQTGLPLRMPESKPFLDNHKAVAFSNDGSRLFLLHDNPGASPESETGKRSLVVLKTQSGEREVIPIPDLPPLAPLEISDDGTWAAYAGARSSNYARSSNVEIWNTRTGKKTATLPPTYRGQHGPGFQVDMFAGGDFIAVADQRTLSVYATKTGRRLSRFPNVPPNDQLPFFPLFLSHNTTQLVFIGMSSELTDPGDSGLWMLRIPGARYHRNLYREIWRQWFVD